MKKNRFLPENKLYALLLCAVIVGAIVYAPSRIKEYYDLAQQGERRILTVKQDGKTLLWGAGDKKSQDSLWFDITDSPIDPNALQFGIGADKIPSIDRPAFVTQEAPPYKNSRVMAKRPVIGVYAEGEPRAYPISIMNRHELVNDTFGDAHLTVAW
jgi:hypothetical protein